MDSSVIKVYEEIQPALRFIGKKYSDSDRVDGSFGQKWQEWFANDWFEEIKPNSYQEVDATIGLMRWKENEAFEYWIGMFCLENSEVPSGYDYVDFKASEVGVCWLYGKDGEIYKLEHLCSEKLEEAGYKIIPDDQGAFWFFERYVCPGFTTPDEHGNIILDICHYVSKQ